MMVVDIAENAKVNTNRASSGDPWKEGWDGIGKVMDRLRLG